ncbi:MAG: co-chaperone GroES [Holophagales bacterium]|nr:MAG: co-chaperone GroES [Holophagales bacterium]
MRASANGASPFEHDNAGPSTPSWKESRPVKIRPLHDRVVVKRIEAQEQVRGGIIIPDTAKEKPQEAEVIAVGPGKVNDNGQRAPMDVKAGDRILIGKYSGSEIKLADDELVILREDEILAVLDK